MCFNILFYNLIDNVVFFHLHIQYAGKSLKLILKKGKKNAVQPKFL